MKVTFWRIAFFFAMLLVVANNAKGNLRIICKSNMKTSGVSISLYMTGIHFPSQEVIWSSVHLYKVKNIHLRRDHLLASVIAENIWTMLSTCYFSAGWSVLRHEGQTARLLYDSAALCLEDKLAQLWPPYERGRWAAWASISWFEWHPPAQLILWMYVLCTMLSGQTRWQSCITFTEVWDSSCSAVM